MGKPPRRDTQATQPSLSSNPEEIARLEVRNGFAQAYEGEQMAMVAIDRGEFKLRASHILTLHRKALDGLTAYAGVFRPGPVQIGESAHDPPPAYLVPSLIEEMCDFINDNWSKTPLFLAAYAMWRLNWIHPFTDGNGRTSRIVAYVVLSIRAGYVPSGAPSIPAQIEADRTPYFRALEDSDRAWAGGKLDLDAMETLLSRLLARQLLSFFESAGGKPIDDEREPTDEASLS